MGARLKFTIPADGFAATPVVTAGGVTVVADEDSYSVGPVKLVIDASAFKRKRQVLVKTAADSTEALQKLIANVEYVGGRGRGILSVEDDGTSLVYSPRGMILTFR